MQITTTHRSPSQHVAVTGSAGFTGLHLLRALHAAGADITAITIAGKPTSGLDSLPFEFQRVVVDDVTRIGDAITEVAPDKVVHLNAFVSTDRSFNTIDQTMRWNVMSTISLLTACVGIEVKRVVLMGSCDEFGQRFCPFDPLRASDPNSPYGASKAAATSYARMFHSSFSLPTVVLRPSVVYGPGQSPKQLISMVMHALSENRPIDVTLGEQTRDFVYIDDTVHVIMEALDSDAAILGEDYNVGSGEVVTVRHCLELIEQITGRAGLIRYGGRPYSSNERFQYEPILDQTYKAFKWRPSVMLEEGLRRTWASFLDQKSRH